MYRFQHSEYLWFLILIPIIAALYFFYLSWRRKGIRKLGNYELIKHQLHGFIAGRSTSKFFLSLAAITCIIIGLANIQKGAQAESGERKGVDVMFALDVSKSMLANDIQPNRLTRAKQLIETMMDKMKNDRVGLVIFAGRAYLQTPLTVDYTSAKMLLSTVGPNDVPFQGTAIGEAIDYANQSFSTKEKKYKTLILITDGEDHDNNAEKMAQEASRNGVVIHTIGVGSPDGAPIIDPNTHQEKVDKDGKPVISKLNESILKNIAATGHGSYQLLTNANAVANNLNSEISSMEARNMGVVTFTEYDSYFQYFLLAALLLLVVDWLLPTAKKINTPKLVK